MTQATQHRNGEPDLDARDQAMLAGDHGPTVELAMRLLVAVARAERATHLIDVASAHIDGCLFHGQAGLDFAERLAAGGGLVVIPTTLNVASLDLLHPALFRGDDESRLLGRRLMDAYVSMGCQPTWTCAPYQLPSRPAFGEHVAWAESNAIVFANSVLGARTDRYGDFLDICAALTGRVPYAGLHVEERRRATVVLDLGGIPDQLLAEDVFYPVLGHLVGSVAVGAVPVLVGLPSVSEDRMKALGAAAASTGGVALCHVVGTTPEAPSLEAALQGGRPDRTLKVRPAQIRAARDSLSTTTDDRIDAVSVGTPHFSVAEFGELVRLVDGLVIAPGVRFLASTSRSVLAEITGRGWAEALEAVGIEFVTDTCTYVTPILDPACRTVMTDSAKWAYYAPGNIGVEVVFGSLRECVWSAAVGRVVRDRELWHGI
ncbi:MAG: aconitase X catalytic domain-containing protein [Chloroflexota bacterium]